MGTRRLALPLAKPERLDMLWVSYFACGNAAYVERITTALSPPDAEERTVAQVPIEGAARWPLSSNARQHEDVRRSLQELCVRSRGAIRGELEAILERFVLGMRRRARLTPWMRETSRLRRLRTPPRATADRRPRQPDTNAGIDMMTSPPEGPPSVKAKHLGLVVGLGVMVGTIVGAVVGNVGLGVSYGIIGGTAIFFVLNSVGRGRGP